MPEVVAEALVALRPQMSPAELEREVKVGADRAGAQFGRRMQTAMTAVKTIFAAEVVRRGAQAIGALADASSNLEEAQNAANVVFKDATGIVADFADTSALALGISQRAALEASAQFGGMFNNIGLASDASATLSRGAVQLAGDLASIKNLRVDEALQKIQAGLAGEGEALRRYGVDIGEEAVKNEARIQGLSGELNQGQKTLIRYTLILKQLDEAQGDFNRTSEGYANTQRQLQASLEDLSATAGGTFTPALAEMAGNFAFAAKTANDFTTELGFTGGLGDVVKNVGVALGVINPLLSAWRKRADDGSDAAKIYAETQKAIRDAVDGATNSIEDQQKALDDQVKALLSVDDAFLEQRTAARDVTQAQKELRDAELDYQDALKGTGVYAEKAADAAEKLEDAHRGLARAQQRVKELTWELSDAQQELAEAVFRFGPGSKEAEDAARALESAQFDLAEAETESAESAKDLAEAQDEATEASKRTKAIEDAFGRLEDAGYDLERATLRAVQADIAHERQLAESRGEVFDTRDAIDAAKTSIERWAAALGDDSEFATNLRRRIDDLRDLREEATILSIFSPGPAPEERIGSTSMRTIEGTSTTTTSTATTPVPAPAPGVSEGGMGSYTNYITVNYPVTFDQLLEHAEYESGVRG